AGPWRRRWGRRSRACPHRGAPRARPARESKDSSAPVRPRCRALRASSPSVRRSRPRRAPADPDSCVASLPRRTPHPADSTVGHGQVAMVTRYGLNGPERSSGQTLYGTTSNGRGKGTGQRAKGRKGYREKGKGKGTSAPSASPRGLYYLTPSRASVARTIDMPWWPEAQPKGRPPCPLSLFPVTFAYLCPLPFALSPSVTRFPPRRWP